MSKYFDNLCTAMKMVEAHQNALFVGQAVKFPGTAMFRSLEHIDPDRRIEFPVAEDMQLGFCTGLSIAGYLPVAIYPRWNFLLLAANQLVNHLDKLPQYSAFKPKVIIRVGVPTRDPLNPGPQHLGDFSSAFREMLLTIPVVQLRRPEEILPAYRSALDADGSTVLVEYTQFYEDKGEKRETLSKGFLPVPPRLARALRNAKPRAKAKPKPKRSANRGQDGNRPAVHRKRR